MRGINNNPNKNAPPAKLGKRETGKILLRLAKHVFAHWPLFILAIALTLISNQLSLLGPEFSGNAIDAMDTPHGVDYATVIDNVVRMVFCYVAAALLS